MVWSSFSSNRESLSTARSALAGARRAHGAPPGGCVQADCRACFRADALDLRHEGLLLCVPYSTLQSSVPYLSMHSAATCGIVLISRTSNTCKFAACRLLAPLLGGAAQFSCPGRHLYNSGVCVTEHFRNLIWTMDLLRV